jgi:hypothetical protein
MPSFAPLALAVAVSLDHHTAALCDRLADAAYRSRSAAARRLAALGPLALPALRHAAAGPDAEAATRAAELADRIASAAEHAARTAPSLVRLYRPAATAADVFAAIEEQTGCRFVVPSAVAEEVRLKPVRVVTGGPVPFWQAVDLAADAAGLAVADNQPVPRRVTGPYGGYYERPSGYVSLTRTEADPTVPPVLLVPRGDGPARPAWRGGAVRVAASPVPADARPGFARGTAAVLLSVAAEPRLAWVRTTGVRVTGATAADGTRLAPDLVVPPYPYTPGGSRGDQITSHPLGNLYHVRRADRTDVVWVPTDPAAAVARVRTDADAPRLGSLAGTVYGVIRTAPAEAAGVTVVPGKTAAVAGDGGITLKAAVDAADAGGGYPVEAVVLFPAFRVTPLHGSDRDLRQAQWVAQRGVPMRPRESRWWSPDDGPVIEGVTVTDAAGSAFALSGVGMSTGYSLYDGEVYVLRTVRLLARPTAATSGPPKRVAFVAAVERTAEATFTLRDVPALGGTGER